MKGKLALSLFVLAALALAMCGICIWQSVTTHHIEMAEQIAKFGFYKQDIVLDIGRNAAWLAWTVGIVLSVIVLAISTVFGVYLWSVKR